MDVDTGDFLRDSLMRLEDSLQTTQSVCEKLNESVYRLDKDIAVLEAKMRNQTAIIAGVGTVSIQLAITLLGKLFHW